MKKLPYVPAVETAECGLACLLMIANYHGHDMDLAALRTRFAAPASGYNLRKLMDVAEAVGLTARALRVEIEYLKNTKIPLILHWNFDHFVVLAGYKRGRFVIFDPARGVHNLSGGEVSERFTGVALELQRGEAFKPSRAKTSVPVWKLWSGQEGLASFMAKLLLLSLAVQLFGIAAPYLVQRLVDGAMIVNDHSIILVLGAALGVSLLVQSVMDSLRAWQIQHFGNSFSFQILRNLFHHILRIDMAFLQRRHSGDIVSRLSSVAALQEVIGRGAITAILDGFWALLIGAVLVLYSPVLGLIVLVGVVGSAAATLAIYPKMASATRNQLISSAEERSYLLETIRSLATIRRYGGEASRESRWRTLYARYLTQSLTSSAWQIGLNLTQSLISAATLVVVVTGAALQIGSAKGLSAGMLLAFLMFRQLFQDKCNSLLNQLIQLGMVRVHLDRLGELIEAPSEEGASPDLEVSGSIELRDVSFRYSPADRHILTGINLRVEDGEFIAIVGRSGGGKSTIVKILIGLLRPSGGEVWIGGAFASADRWASLKRQTGTVMQDDVLLVGSIAENISFFDPNPDLERVKAAAQAARISTEIMSMPMGFNTRIGEMSSGLSGGQKQRILIARALYRNPKLLVLDEGTANLDLRSEAYIGGVLSGLKITRVVVAHRPELVMRADRVVEVESGTIKVYTNDQWRSAQSGLGLMNAAANE